MRDRPATNIICLLTTSAALALVFLFAGCGGGSGGGRQFLSIGTAGTGGIYYPLGGAIASRLSIADPIRQYTAEVTGGSVGLLKPPTYSSTHSPRFWPWK